MTPLWIDFRAFLPKLNPKRRRAGALQMKISACIITFNEEENIHAACESVSWADEIVVVDSESTDRTAEIARACGARVIINKWPGFAKQKQFATEAAAHDWVLSLDADERVSPELESSIAALRDRPERRGRRLSARAADVLHGPLIRGVLVPGFSLRLFNGGSEAGAND